MSKKFRFILFLVIGILLIASLPVIGTKADSEVNPPVEQTPVVDKDTKQEHQPRIMVEQSMSPASVGGPDAYGYVWDDGQTYSWIDISVSGTPITFPTYDDDHSVAIPIGFSFPFYEKNYSSVYVSTNGLLTFGTGSGEASNRPFPFIEEPQAVITPLWDDLVVGGSYNSGKVYYQKISADQFVVSYVGVTKLSGGSGDTLSFQVILNANGNITFQYKELNGSLDSATVGIEDHDGVVGLTYLHNADMSTLVNRAVLFTRPAPSRRPKALPLYQGAFAVNGFQSMDLQIYNAGNLGSDAFDLIVNSSNPAWQIRLVDSSGQLITRDTNSNGYVETPLLNPGDEYQITVEFVAPVSAGVGSTAIVNLGVRSMANTSAVWNVKLQSTVPASFVQALKDSGDIDLRAMSRYGQREITVFPLYTGSSMGVEGLTENRFLMYWERNGDRFENGYIVTWTDIEQAVVDDFGQDILNATKITNNTLLASIQQNVFDTEPVSTITDNGNVGVVWVRRIDRRVDNKSNFNIYMAILDADDTTQFVKQPFNVTQNNAWVGLGDLNIPKFLSPRITATPNNTFFLSWTDERLQSAGTESNIGIASYDSLGNSLLSAQQYAGLDSVPGITLFRFSTVYGLSDNRIILGYASFNASTRIYSPGYAVLGTNGSTVFAPRLLTGVEGQYPVIMQLASGSIIYAWTKTETENFSIMSSQIAYVVINPGNYAASSHLGLAMPDGLQGDYVSLSVDENDNAVLTWIDTDLERKLYYALIDSSGTLVTPTMSFYETEAGKALLVNQSGRGNAYYEYRFGIFLPLTVR